MKIELDVRDAAGNVTGLWTHDVTLDDGSFLEMGIAEGQHGYTWVVSGDTERSAVVSDSKQYGSYEHALNAAVSYISGLY